MPGNFCDGAAAVRVRDKRWRKTILTMKPRLPFCARCQLRLTDYFIASYTLRTRFLVSKVSNCLSNGDKEAFGKPAVWCIFECNFVMDLPLQE